MCRAISFVVRNNHQTITVACSKLQCQHANIRPKAEFAEVRRTLCITGDSAMAADNKILRIGILQNTVIRIDNQLREILG